MKISPIPNGRVKYKVSVKVLFVAFVLFVKLFYETDYDKVLFSDFVIFEEKVMKIPNTARAVFL